MTVTKPFTQAQKASLLRHIDAGAALSGTLQSVPRMLRESGQSASAGPMLTMIVQDIHHQDCARALNLANVAFGMETTMLGIYWHLGGAKGVINADRARRQSPTP